MTKPLCFFSALSKAINFNSIMDLAMHICLKDFQDTVAPQNVIQIHFFYFSKTHNRLSILLKLFISRFYFLVKMQPKCQRH